eukprot:Rhum_TRINITY_DN16768_c0_g1::Rhum_TRINITY_DN16768_c0_g1_i1::g.164340::m.164340
MQGLTTWAVLALLAVASSGDSKGYEQLDATRRFDDKPTHVVSRTCFSVDDTAPAFFQEACPRLSSAEAKVRLAASLKAKVFKQHTAKKIVMGRIIAYLQGVERAVALRLPESDFGSPPTFHFTGRSGSGKSSFAFSVGSALSTRLVKRSPCALVTIQLADDSKERIRQKLTAQMKLNKYSVVVIEDYQVACRIRQKEPDTERDAGRDTESEADRLDMMLLTGRLVSRDFALDDEMDLKCATIILTSDLGVSSGGAEAEMKGLPEMSWEKEAAGIMRLAKRREREIGEKLRGASGAHRLFDESKIVPFKPELVYSEDREEVVEFVLQREVVCGVFQPHLHVNRQELQALMRCWHAHQRDANMVETTEEGSGPITFGKLASDVKCAASGLLGELESEFSAELKKKWLVWRRPPLHIDFMYKNSRTVTCEEEFNPDSASIKMSRRVLKDDEDKSQQNTDL